MENRRECPQCGAALELVGKPFVTQEEGKAILASRVICDWCVKIGDHAGMGTVILQEAPGAEIIKLN